MVIRPFRSEDVGPIDDIFRRTQLSVPSLRNVVENCVFEDHQKVVAYGVLKLFAELHLTLDPSLSPFLKAKIIGSGIAMSLKYEQFERIHAIVEDEKEIVMIKKHFGFKEVPGKLLCIEV